MIEQLKEFNHKKILVVGDVMLDHYIHGFVERISPEAPVPVVCDEYHSYALGGAANVANNIASLGGRVSLLGIIGHDDQADTVRELMRGAQIGSFLIDGYKETETKLRILASGQQLLRVDTLVKPIRDGLTVELLKQIERHEQFDTVVLSDYGKGVFNREMVVALQGFGLPLVVDPKPKNTGLFSGAFAMTPNFKEAVEFLGVEKELKVPECAEAFGKKANTRVILTCGARGIYLWDPDGRSGHIPPYSVEAKDPTGAGDVVTATIALGVASKMNLWESCLLANRAAALSVTKLGTYSIRKEELIESLETTPIPSVF